MKHGVPKVIYLQICDDPDCDVPYDDHDGITWCSHRINKTDVKYVLAKDKPQRTWVGLTEEEKEHTWKIAEAKGWGWQKMFDHLEAKLKEKNFD